MEIVDPRNDPEAWDRCISDFPDASFFHSSAWARVLCRAYGHQPFYLRFNGKLGDAHALVPLMEVRSPITGRRGIGLPFSDFCQPLIRDPAEPDLATLHVALANFARDRNWKYLELRGAAPDSLGLTEKPPTFLGHQLDLRVGSETLLAGCSSSVRRALRKATRAQLSASIGHSESAMREFYRLHCLTRRRHGLPPQPYRFFQIIHEELIRQRSGFIVLASRAGSEQPIAAAIFLNFNGQAVYKFGASDEREWELRPNNLVMWEGIRHLAESGAAQLHFGRTSPGQDGLRRFKLSWGSREEAIRYHQFETRSRDWQPVCPSASHGLASRLGHKLFNIAPLAINRLAGQLLYPHLD